MPKVTGDTARVFRACFLVAAFSTSYAQAAPDLVMHSFGQGTDGANPSGSLIKVNGLYYGITSAGGTFGNGTVYSLTPQGVEEVIYNSGRLRRG